MTAANDPLMGTGEQRMITARLDEPDINEMLRYLGYRDQEIPDRLMDQILKCRDEIVSVSVPRLVYRFTPVREGRIAEPEMPGEDIKELLKECDTACLFAVTLGSEAEELIARRQVTSMGDALILDSAASAAIENVCRNFEEDLSALEEFSDRFLTDRFSPGYGDLPLGVQKDFCEFLNARRRIGLTVTDSYLLVPQKSVTAVTGLSGKPQIRKFSGCESCAVKGRCVFRKRGETCRQLTEKQETDQ